MENFSVQTETKGSVAVVTVNGRIDSETATKLDSELVKITGGNSKLVLNLAGVAYMSSAGIRAIVKAGQKVGKHGGAIRLAAVPELVNSVLYTVGLNQKFSSFASVDEALVGF